MFIGQSYSPGSNRRGLSILFSAPLAANQDWNALIKVVDSQDQPVHRDWLLSYNPRSVYMPDLAAGRYTITIEPLVQSRSGEMLNVPLHGPVELH